LLPPSNGFYKLVGDYYKTGASSSDLLSKFLAY
jgi:hypothetical protein